MNVEAGTISAEGLEKKRVNGSHIELIDVRTPVEFRQIHAEGARNIPLDSLDPKHVQSLRSGSGNDPIYVICQSGMRAQKACEKFINDGIANVVLVEGGTEAWQQAGLAVVLGKKAISLERQVRIAAGALVLTGVLLGFFVNVSFLVLSGFVGAGLMFAGITNTCGMALLLAKMPWNQVGNGKKECCSTN